MLNIIFERPGFPTKIVQIPEEQLPSLRSALQELRDELADRVSGRYEFKREAPFTRAIIALGTFAGALNCVVPAGDPGFGPRAHLWPEEKQS